MDNQAFCSIRRAIIENEFLHLNPQQRQAVLKTEGPLLLLAGAGSGKTTVLINRIANLIKFGSGADTTEIPPNVTDDDFEFLKNYYENPQGGEAYERMLRLCSWEPPAPWQIIAITFTNKAAGELKERLSRMLGSQGDDVWAMTFHSACCRILRRNIELLGFNSDFTIYDSSDSERTMKAILKENKLDDKSFPPKTVLRYISTAKDKLQSPEDFIKEAEINGDYRLKKIGMAYKQYVEQLKAANALDFDDIILFTVKLLMENEDVRQYYQKKFHYVLIDEYQDTNNLQYLLASILAGGYENICVVGDDDQSIYKFRGATIKNIMSFEAQYPSAQVIRLEQNYRSTKAILAAANSVISNNRDRKGKTLWTNNPPGDPVVLYQAENENTEANYVASRILEGITKGRNLSEYAVLYRMNAQSNALEYSFKRNGIPYKVIGGMKFFDRAEVKDMLAYLCLINNRYDDLRLTRIINVPARGIGDRTIEQIGEIARQKNQSLYTIVCTSAAYPELSKSTNKLMAFVTIIEELSAALATTPLPDFYDMVVDKTGYSTMLLAKGDSDSLNRLENVKELKTSIINYCSSTENPTLSGFLEEIALYTDLDNLDENSSYVVMMTMHSAKGLEFPTVFIVGAEEGIFPSVRTSSDNSELEEERRLCYVALTRAQKELYILHAKSRMLFGRTGYNPVSRFVKEIPSEFLNDKSTENKTRKASYSWNGNGQFVSSGSKPQTQSKKPYSSYTRQYTPAQIPSYSKGDRVQHKSFGSGTVTNVVTMGNDAMLEIAFDDIGTKKLMAKAASEHMKKQ